MLLSTLLSCLLFVCGVSLAVAPESTDPVEIMKAVETAETGDQAVGRLKITTSDRAGRARERVVRTWAMEVEAGQRGLMIFESPADLRNAGLLTFDPDDPAASDDQWLYLPSLGKPTRISSAEKSGSFLGTDLTYADMTRRDPDAYDYTLLEGEAEVNGEACWLIEARPKTDREKAETGYLKSHFWISKSKLVPVQSKAWVLEGKRLKYSQFTDLRELDGIWVAHKTVVRTVRNGELESQSELVLTEMAFGDPSVTPELFSERRLEQGL